MRDLEGFARQAFEKIAGDRFARREADRVHQTVQVIPGFAEIGEQRIDLLVAADVAVEHQLAVEFFREIGDAVLEALADIGECQFGAFALAGLGDAIGDGAVGQQAGDQDFFALQECHE